MENQSMFVKIEKHEDILSMIKNIRQKTASAKDKIKRIRELDAEEHQKLAEFDEAVNHIDTNLDHVSGYLKQ